MAEYRRSGLFSTINTVLVLVFASIALFLGLQRADKALRLKAMGDCEMSSRYEKQIDENTKIAYVAVDIYKSCMKDKGY